MAPPGPTPPRWAVRCALSRWRHDGSACCPGDIVRRRRHAPVAGVARKNAEAVRAADRHVVDLPAGARPCHLRGPVRPADDHHQFRVPLRRRRAGARPRRQGHHHPGAAAPRFRGRHRRCRRTGGEERSRGHPAGGRRRPPHPRHRAIHRRVPRRAAGGDGGLDRHLRRQAHLSRVELRLYPSAAGAGRDGRFARSKPSSRSPTRRPRRAMSPTAICGTAETSCSAPR